MAYILNEITIRTNNTVDGMKKIDEVWHDVTSGKLPILFDSEHNFRQGISPVSRYSNYSSDETGEYDLSIIGVKAEFFAEMERKTAEGHFKKYDISDGSGDKKSCTQKAWEKVWADTALPRRLSWDTGGGGYASSLIADGGRLNPPKTFSRYAGR